MPEKREESPVNKLELDLDPSLKDLAGLVIEGLKKEYKPGWEMEAEYTKRIKSHLYVNFERFQNRFIKGYGVLMEVLSELEKK